MTYQATITHSSISSARKVQCTGDLTQAKRQATAEFGAEQRDYTIVILDERNEVAASRRVADKTWANA